MTTIAHFPHSNKPTQTDARPCINCGRDLLESSTAAYCSRTCKNTFWKQCKQHGVVPVDAEKHILSYAYNGISSRRAKTQGNRPPPWAWPEFDLACKRYYNWAIPKDID